MLVDPDFVVAVAAQRVEAWSVRRLPFEPKGSMLDLRSALRSAIRDLEPVGLIRCAYASPSSDFCDAENVLLYNVGMSAFSHVLREGVAFERRFAPPPSPAPLSGPALPHHLYSSSTELTTPHWRRDTEVVSWSSSLPAKLTKAADWWWTTRASDRTVSIREHLSQRFALDLRVGGLNRPLGGVLKPMLDGIIAAFHRDLAADRESVTRLAQHLQQPEAEVVRELATEDAPLGTRVLVRPFRDGLQWNPADDLCVACRVEVRDDSRTRAVEGQLFSVSESDT